MATSTELVCPGGEVAFITRLIDESCILRTRLALYSSLVGRKSSLRVLLRLLREKGVPSMGTGVLYQGKTCRWVLCWSFDPAFGTEMNKSPQKYKVLGHKKQRKDLSFCVPISSEEAWERIRAFCRACGVGVGVGSDSQGVRLKEEEEVVCEVRNYVYRFPGNESVAKEEEEGELECSFAIDVEEEENTEVVLTLVVVVVGRGEA